MSTKATSLVWNAEIRGTPRWVLMAMADYANPQGGDIFPGNEDLTEKVKDGRRTVIKAVRELVAEGYLVIAGERRRRHGQVDYRPVPPGELPRGGAGWVTDYVINYQKLRGGIDPTAEAKPDPDMVANFERVRELHPSITEQPANAPEAAEAGKDADPARLRVPQGHPFGDAADQKGCSSEQKRVQDSTKKGAGFDTAHIDLCEPSGNHQEPSRERGAGAPDSPPLAGSGQADSKPARAGTLDLGEGLAPDGAPPGKATKFSLAECPDFVPVITMALRRAEQPDRFAGFERRYGAVALTRWIREVVWPDVRNYWGNPELRKRDRLKTREGWERTLANEIDAKARLGITPENWWQRIGSRTGGGTPGRGGAGAQRRGTDAYLPGSGKAAQRREVACG